MKPYLFLVVLFLFPILVFSQGKWNLLTQNPYSTFDDVAMSPSGEIFASVSNRDLVISSSDLGKHWTVIPEIETPVNPYNFRHTLEFYGTTLIKFVWYFGPYGIVYKDGKFQSDSARNCQKLYLLESMEHPQYCKDNLYIGKENKSVYILDSNWCSYNKIITDGDVVQLFVYPNAVYGIERSDKGTYLAYSYDIQAKQSKLLSPAIVNYSFSNCHITSQGVIFKGFKGGGLYKSIDGGIKFEQVIFNQQSGAQTQFVEMVNTMNNDLLIRTEGGFYLTDPSGNSYTYLHGLSQNVPQNIRKWIVKDSNTVVVLAEQDTRQMEMFIYSKVSSWQPQTSSVHRYNIFRILKMADGRLCGTFDGSTINKVSSDEGLTWSNFTYDSSAVIRVINIDTSSDILLTQKAKLYISFDKNKNWLDITPITGATNPEVYYFQNGRIAFLVKWPSGKRDVYLSSDFGKTWKNRLNDVGFYPSLYYAIDKINNWILTIYSSNYGTVYKSADDGYSWVIDDRFKEFHRVSDLKIQADGTMLAAAKRDSDGLAGIFISRNNQPFQLLSQDLSKSNFQIFDKYYPDILVFSIERGILRVDVNTGAITAKYNEGLPTVLPGSDFVWINGMIWDKEDQLYISIGFDNMYKNEIGFVTAVEPISKGSSLGQLQFYNNRLYLETKDEINISSSVVLEISDVVGRTIYKTKLGKDQLLSGFEIPFQAQGIYCIQVIDKVKQQKWRSKISVVR